jgi:predicted nucleic acid-binding protein
MSAATLVDTNVLVYRFDARFPEKQKIATDTLRAGLTDGSMRLPHQAVLEFVAALTRSQSGGEPILSRAEALREAEELLGEFEILYPDEALIRLALHGASAYQLSWYDAHMWAYAERYSIPELLSEDFQHDRLYGTVRVRNPFA